MRGLGILLIISGVVASLVQSGEATPKSVGLSSNDGRKFVKSPSQITNNITNWTVKVPSVVYDNGGKDTRELIKDFLRDAQSIQHLKANDNLLTPCRECMRDKNYTHTWTFDDWENHQERSLKRYWNHMRSLPFSTTAQGVMPAVIAITIYSLAVVAVMQSDIPVISSLVHKVSLSLQAMSMFVAPMALLLTLRTNRAMDRLLEARRSWGMMIRSVRTLSGLVSAHILPRYPQFALIIIRYLSVFPWTFKALLRRESDMPVLETLLPPDELQWILTTAHHPRAITCRIRQLLAIWLAHEPQNSVLHLELEERLCGLEQCIGICNRIVTSPIPPTYTRHTSRVLCVYLSLLPLALSGMGLSPLATVITTAMLTYIFAGIDEIGVEIEFPFLLLPLYDLAVGAQNNVISQVTMMQNMPLINL